MRNALLAVVLLATIACGAYQFPGPGNGSGTVSGQVISTPCGQAEPAIQPCMYPGPDSATACAPPNPNGGACGGKPMQGLQLYFNKGDTTLTAKTDSNGYYSIALPSGTWSVNTRGIMRIISGPQVLDVKAGSTLVANYVVDTGIRTAV